TTANALWKFTGSVDYATGNTRPNGSFAWVDGSDPSNISDVTLTSPIINTAGLTTPALKFDFFSNNTGIYPNNILTVQGNSGTGWVTLFTNNTSSNQWRTELIALPASFANANVSFRFVVDKTAAPSSNAFYNDILLDDVSVIEAPTCFTPIITTATNVSHT